MNTKVWVGIDPDVNKSGVAYWNPYGKELILYNMKFFQLFSFLDNFRAKNELEVIIEAGWLNKSNWHSVKGTPALNAQIGQRTGANHETGKKIAEMCEYLGIDYELSIPKSSKWDKEFFRKLTGYKGGTNQEQRDAAALVYGR